MPSPNVFFDQLTRTESGVPLTTHYFFDEPLGGTGKVHVCQNAFLSQDGSYTSKGNGIFVILGLSLQMSQSSTVTWATPE